MYFSALVPAVFVCMPLSFGMSMRIFLNVVMVNTFVYAIFSVYVFVGWCLKGLLLGFFGC